MKSQTTWVTFPQTPNPEAELQFLLSHPDARVCPSPLAGQTVSSQDGAIMEIQRRISQMEQLRRWNASFYGGWY